MGRPRSAGRRDLPPGLELHSSGLYRYKRPDTGRYVYLTKDKAASIEAANQANAILLKQTSLLEKVVDPRAPTFKKVVEWFRDEKLPEIDDLAASTRAEKKRMLDVMALRASTKPIDEMSVLDCDELLGEVTKGKRARDVYRTLGIQVFKAAGAKGWTADNPMARTEELDPKKQRLPLTLEWFNLIREKARPEIAGAMDLALQTLQRESDISSMPMPRGGLISFVQQKTGKALSLEVTAEIDAVAQRFLATGVICPFIVRAKPRKMRPTEKRAKERRHFAQLLPEQLSRGFAEARDQLEVFQEMPAAKRPSFHEIRGLGGHLYKTLMGWTDEQVQALMGHEDVGQTRDYTEPHGPVYQRVAAGLKL